MDQVKLSRFTEEHGEGSSLFVLDDAGQYSVAVVDKCYRLGITTADGKWYSWADLYRWNVEEKENMEGVFE